MNLQHSAEATVPIGATAEALPDGNAEPLCALAGIAPVAAFPKQLP